MIDPTEATVPQLRDLIMQIQVLNRKALESLCRKLVMALIEVKK